MATASGTKKAPWCAPTLYVKHSDPPVFDYACTLVLAASGDDQWHGGYYMTEKEQVDLLHHIDKDMFGDSTITLKELTSWLLKEANQKYVQSLPSAVHGLMNSALVKEAFKAFDFDGSGTLDTSEWERFLDELAFLRLSYLLNRALLSYRAFFGRGQPWTDLDHPDILCKAAGITLEKKGFLQHAASQMSSYVSVPNSSPRDRDRLPSDPAEEMTPAISPRIIGAPSKRTVQFGLDGSGSLFPAGWRHDFSYYSANNHPLHGIFASDPLSRLNRCEWLMLEIATLGLMFVTSTLKNSMCVQGQVHAIGRLDGVICRPFVFSLVVVTIPGIIIWQALFFLFTCPVCGLVDESQSHSEVKQKARRWSMLGECFGYLIMALGVLGDAWLIHTMILTRSHMHLSTVAIARVQGYIIAWLVMFFLSFNPLLAWGQPDPNGGFCLGDLIGLGQWRIEKQRFQHHCCHALTSWLTSPRKKMPRQKVRSLQGMFSCVGLRDGFSRNCGNPAIVVSGRKKTVAPGE